MGELKRIERSRLFDGWLETWEHPSGANNCRMRFAVYLPPQAEQGPVPAVYWLSGLTCTEENFMVKSGAQRYAAELGLALVAPDTSPRGAGVPDDEAYDFGQGAGFYLNATEPPWSRHYRMYDYVTRELPALIEANFPVRPGVKSISGHSMGGHGALVAALREPDAWRSVSAFAPVCAPMRCPWGVKAFSHYLGPDRAAWATYDASCLVREARSKLPLRVEQGDADEFLVEQLRPELLEQACREADYPLDLRWRSGYDHSYFFIATFIGEHLRDHARSLGA